MRLYDLTHNYLSLLEMIEEGDDRYLDTIEALDDAIEDKAENYARVIKSVDAGVAGLKAEEKRLAERRKFMENSVVRMKKSLEESMIATGKTKFKGEFFSFAIQKNPASVEVLNDTIIPEIFFTQPEPVLDKRVLLETLKLGHIVEGVQLKQTESLRIR